MFNINARESLSLGACLGAHAHGGDIMQFPELLGEMEEYALHALAGTEWTSDDHSDYDKEDTARGAAIDALNDYLNEDNEDFASLVAAEEYPGLKRDAALEQVMADYMGHFENIIEDIITDSHAV